MIDRANKPDRVTLACAVLMVALGALAVSLMEWWVVV